MSAKQSLYHEIEAHLLQDEAPSLSINEISQQESFCEYPFSFLTQLRKTEQSPIYHPEGNVWNHTMLVVDEAARVRTKSTSTISFMWAALLHDIGKADTTKIKKGKITSYNHDEVGALMAEKFLTEFSANQSLIDEVVALVRWHMQILFVVNDLPFGDIKMMKQQSDINEIALLGLCDRMGRLNANRNQEEKTIQLFLKKCKATDSQGI